MLPVGFFEIIHIGLLQNGNYLRNSSRTAVVIGDSQRCSVCLAGTSCRSIDVRRIRIGAGRTAVAEIPGIAQTGSCRGVCEQDGTSRAGVVWRKSKSCNRNRQNINHMCSSVMTATGAGDDKSHRVASRCRVGV
ncbi:hypothetical protein SDC9_105023 [bioreactor metagenome]|uniref:Uncharacterized protein n=1 Tax=bioreactor metagenome TaxID=1076179 RepID=A0A645B4W9_9ZZZZ